jgi:hypothetical protein
LHRQRVTIRFGPSRLIERRPLVAAEDSDESPNQQSCGHATGNAVRLGVGYRRGYRLHREPAGRCPFNHLRLTSNPARGAIQRRPGTSRDVHRHPVNQLKIRFSKLLSVLRCSRDIRGLPAAATTFWGYARSRRARTPHARDSLEIQKSARWLRRPRSALFESVFRIRTCGLRLLLFRSWIVRVRPEGSTFSGQLANGAQTELSYL